MSKSPITSHVLDTSVGRPAVGVRVALYVEGVDGGWSLVGEDSTNADGRVQGLCPEGFALQLGVYKVTFDTGAYYAASGTPGFYPKVEVMCTVADASQHYHIPLLLNPFGYSTYRGS